MPILSSEDYGTDEQGSRSFAYCYHCFSGGRFTDEGISMEDKIEENVKMAVKLGMDEKVARRMARKIIPTLTRWKKQNNYEAVAR